jgi:hypothetical protein
MTRPTNRQVLADMVRHWPTEVRDEAIKIVNTSSRPTIALKRLRDRAWPRRITRRRITHASL